MFQTMFNRGSLPIVEQVAHFTTARHRVLVNNIINAETPDYKALDLSEKDFARALEKSIQERDRRNVPVFEFTGHRSIHARPSGIDAEIIESPNPGMLKHTGNNVDPDTEMSKLVDNVQRHNFAVGVLAHQMSLLREAIQGRIGG